MDYIIRGFQPNPYKYMAEAKVLLMSSTKSEGFPLSPMEAMSLGVPIVCTGVGGLKELVVDGENGFICEDIDSMENALKLLLTDKSLWRQMSDKAIMTAKEQNDMEMYIKKIKHLYE